MTTISPNGLHLIEEFEGFSATQYNDGTGVMTIGFGTTSADVNPLPKEVTREEAEYMLKIELGEKYEPAINALNVPLNQNQYDALCSFVYNLGPGILEPQHTIGALLRARDYAGAANALLLYDDPGTNVTAGLRRRREAERTLFLTPPAPPPPPPDPHHYEWFPVGPFELAGRKLNERALVQEYDRLRVHPFLHRPRLSTVRHYLGLLASRVETIDEETGDSSAYHRGWRRTQLDRRASGQRLA